jgi:Flp pilus assembly pilin Flp
MSGYKQLNQFLRAEDGWIAMEYAAVVSLVAILCIVSVQHLGDEVRDYFVALGKNISGEFSDSPREIQATASRNTDSNTTGSGTATASTISPEPTPDLTSGIKLTSGINLTSGLDRGPKKLTSDINLTSGIPLPSVKPRGKP